MLLLIGTVIHHRDIVAKRNDRREYSYLRDDCIEQICDRLLVPLFVCIC